MIDGPKRVKCKCDCEQHTRGWMGRSLRVQFNGGALDARCSFQSHVVLGGVVIGRGEVQAEGSLILREKENSSIETQENTLTGAARFSSVQFHSVPSRFAIVSSRGDERFGKA